MKIILSMIMCFSFLVGSDVTFYGKSYIVYDALNNSVVDGKNIDDLQSVASISKIMTAIIVIENMSLNTEIEVDNTIDKAYGSCVYIHVGDKITIQDLLYGLMLRSGNDCALMLAKATSGSVDKFVAKMNIKASEVGMTNSSFSNPSGLDEEDPGNISSVHDMALLYDYCCANPLFNQIVSTKKYQRLDGNGSWTNKNKLLLNYDYCVGGKTGFTKKARRTLVTRAVKDNIDLIIVTFNCGNDFEFHQNKYESVFKKYSKVKLFDKGILNYNNHNYVLEKDLIINSYDNQSVNVEIVDNKLLVYNSNSLINEVTIKPYNYNDGVKIVFMDLLYE